MSVYRVDLRSGSYCVKQALPRLKVAKDWGVPVDRVFSEIDYLRSVSAIVPGRVPHDIGRAGATKSFVMKFFGPEFRNWKAQYAETWARERGCSVVRLWSTAARKEAHRFYQQLGYTNIKTQYSFAKSLNADAGDGLRKFVPRIE